MIERIVSCPRCKRSTVYHVRNPYRPFCSRGCKNEDIIGWANEDFRIPVKEEQDELKHDLKPKVDS